MTIDIPITRMKEVRTQVTLETMKELYEIVLIEDCTVDELVRKFIEKGVSEYGN